MQELEDWPVCARENCDNEYNPKRALLGYDTCLDCGSREPIRTIAQLHQKSGLQLIVHGDIDDIV